MGYYYVDRIIHSLICFSDESGNLSAEGEETYLEEDFTLDGSYFMKINTTCGGFVLFLCLRVLRK